VCFILSFQRLLFLSYLGGLYTYNGSGSGLNLTTHWVCNGVHLHWERGKGWKQKVDCNWTGWNSLSILKYPADLLCELPRLAELPLLPASRSIWEFYTLITRNCITYEPEPVRSFSRDGACECSVGSGGCFTKKLPGLSREH